MKFQNIKKATEFVWRDRKFIKLKKAIPSKSHIYPDEDSPITAICLSGVWVGMPYSFPYGKGDDASYTQIT